MPVKNKKRIYNKQKKKAKIPKQRLVHKPHFHAIFSIIVLSMFIALLSIFVIGKPPTYDELTDVNSNNNSFHLKVPSIMKQTYSGENALQYEHQQEDDAAGVLALVRVQSQYLTPNELKKIKPKIIGQLKSKSGGYFESLIESSTQAESNNTQYGNVRKIHSNFEESWLIEFSYVEGNQTIHGVSVVAFKDSMVYVLTIKALEDIWQNNQNTWNQILESFES